MEEKINFVKISETKRAILSIQRTGFPVFLSEAIKIMGLKEEHFFKVAKGKHSCIFLFPTQDSNGSLRVNRYGRYFYTTNKELFRQLGFIRNKKYTVTQERYLGQIIFKIHL